MELDPLQGWQLDPWKGRARASTTPSTVSQQECDTWEPSKKILAATPDWPCLQAPSPKEQETLDPAHTAPKGEGAQLKKRIKGLDHLRSRGQLHRQRLSIKRLKRQITAQLVLSDTEA